MAYNKKTWKNRISENPLRRMITNITTGVSEIIDVTRYEGIITEAGDAFSAANMNDLENRIEQGINDAGSSDIIAPTEEGPLSANAYTVGQYLIYNKINYRVIQPIAVGNSLVPGTNLVEKKVADELSNHLVVNGNAFYFDVHDGEFGYNTSELRGADTFVPFKRTTLPPLYFASGVARYGRNITMTSGLYTKGTAITQTVSHGETYQGIFSLNGISSAKVNDDFGYYGANAINKDGLTVSVPVNGTVFDVSDYDILFINQTDVSGSSFSMSITLS